MRRNQTRDYLDVAALAHARQAVADDEREQLAREVRALLNSSGLTAAQFTTRWGYVDVSFSTYSSGKTSPGATLMVRMRRVADAAPGSGTLVAEPAPASRGSSGAAVRRASGCCGQPHTPV